MDERQRYIRLGLFVITSAALLFTILFLLGGRSLFQPSLTVETYFNDSVSGLEVGAPVRYRGVELGRVSAVDLSTVLYEAEVPVEKRTGYIVVRAKITGERVPLWRRELQAYVARGLRVRTQLAGITGQQYLSLDFVDPQRHTTLPFDWKPKYGYVPSAPSATSQLFNNVQNLISNLDSADIQQLAHNLNTLLVTVNSKVEELPVGELAADAEVLLKDLRGAVSRVDRMIAQAPIDEMLRDLASASARADALLADPALHQMAANASAITGRVRKLADNGEFENLVKDLDLAVHRVNALLAENQYDIRGVVQDLRVTSNNLRAVSEILRRYPSGLLIGGPPEKVPLANDSRKVAR